MVRSKKKITETQREIKKERILKILMKNFDHISLFFFLFRFCSFSFQELVSFYKQRNKTRNKDYKKTKHKYKTGAISIVFCTLHAFGNDTNEYRKYKESFKEKTKTKPVYRVVLAQYISSLYF